MLNWSAESIFLLTDSRRTLDTNCGVRLLFSKEGDIGQNHGNICETNEADKTTCYLVKIQVYLFRGGYRGSGFVSRFPDGYDRGWQRSRSRGSYGDRSDVTVLFHRNLSGRSDQFWHHAFLLGQHWRV